MSIPSELGELLEKVASLQQEVEKKREDLHSIVYSVLKRATEVFYLILNDFSWEYDGVVKDFDGYEHKLNSSVRGVFLGLVSGFRFGHTTGNVAVFLTIKGFSIYSTYSSTLLTDVLIDDEALLNQLAGQKEENLASMLAQIETFANQAEQDLERRIKNLEMTIAQGQSVLTTLS